MFAIFFSLPNRKVCLLIDRENSLSTTDCLEYVAHRTVLLQLQAADYSKFDATTQNNLCNVIVNKLGWE